MYMHLFQTNRSKPFDLTIGRKYQVRGYHTGDFTGKCVEASRSSAVFEVCESWPKKQGIKIEVQLLSGRVKIEAL
jgi:hypothetical protein